MAAGIEVDPIPGDTHQDSVRRSVGFFPQAQAGEEPRQSGRAGKTDFPGGMALGFEQQEPEDEIPQFPPAVLLQDTDVPQPVGAVFPPDAAGSRGEPVLKNQDVPAEGIEAVPAAAEDRFAYRQDAGREIRSGSEPFTLNHRKTPFTQEIRTRGRTEKPAGEKTMDPKKIARINELARKKKETGLTAEEAAEQAALRREYLDGFRENMKAVLDGVIIQEPDGTRHHIQKKK